MDVAATLCLLIALALAGWPRLLASAWRRFRWPLVAVLGLLAGGLYAWSNIGWYGGGSVPARQEAQIDGPSVSSSHEAADASASASSGEDGSAGYGYGPGRKVLPSPRPVGYRTVADLLMPSELPKDTWGTFGILLLADHSDRADLSCHAFSWMVRDKSNDTYVIIDHEILGLKRVYWPLANASIDPLEQDCDILVSQYDFERSARIRGRLGLMGRGPFFAVVKHVEGRPRPLGVWDMSGVPDDELTEMYSTFLDFYRSGSPSALYVRANGRQRFKTALYSAAPAVADLWGVSKANAKTKGREK